MSKSLKITRLDPRILDSVHWTLKYLAIFTDFPLLSVSISANSCWSLSIKSANLLISLERSNPVTFFPQVVVNALRAAATATSISFADANEMIYDIVTHVFKWDVSTADAPATTWQITSSVAGLIALSSKIRMQNRNLIAKSTDSISSCESTEGTNSLLMKSPVGTEIFLPEDGIVIFTDWAIVGRRAQDHSDKLSYLILGSDSHGRPRWI